MQYGNWTFYALCWALAQVILLAASLCDARMARFRRARPWAWQGVVLLLTAVCLYGSDSNKGGEVKPPTPPPTLPKIYIHRDEAGVMRAFAVFVDEDTGTTLTNELSTVSP